jgi:hypothetical protein
MPTIVIVTGSWHKWINMELLWATYIKKNWQNRRSNNRNDGPHLRDNLLWASVLL